MKFGVMNGYVASGRTTGMFAVASALEKRGLKVALLFNDMGGDFVDEKIASARHFAISSLGASCLGCQNANLVKELRRLDADGFDVVLAEMPAICSCVNDHVYLKLKDGGVDGLELLPLTVVIAPKQVESLYKEFGNRLDKPNDDIDDPMNYLLKQQLTGADLIVLNKCDLITTKTRDDYLRLIEAINPKAHVEYATFTEDGSGTAIADLYASGTVALNYTTIWNKVDKAFYGRAEKQLTWFSEAFYIEAESDEDIDFAGFRALFARRIVDAVHDIGGSIAHLKVFADLPCKPSRSIVPDHTAFDVVDEGELRVLSELNAPHHDLRATLNLRALSDGQPLYYALRDVVEETVAELGLRSEVYRIECFNMSDITTRRYRTMDKLDHDVVA